MTESIEEQYQYFGPDVVHVIHSEISLQGDLLRLLRRLNLQTPHELHNQHIVLRDFIFRYGIAFFLKSVRGNLSTNEIERQKTDKLMHDIGRDPRVKPPQRQKSDPGLESPSTGPPAGVKGRRATDKLQPSGLAQAAPAQNAAPAAPTQQQGSGKLIDTPTYKGPDRRIGGERRKNAADRRQSTEVVFKNRRFGGDRRKMIRREEDRLKLGKK
jgi:hypothetical protein